VIFLIGAFWVAGIIGMNNRCPVQKLNKKFNFLFWTEIWINRILLHIISGNTCFTFMIFIQNVQNLIYILLVSILYMQHLSSKDFCLLTVTVFGTKKMLKKWDNF
jgi:hypothetical protein